MKVGEILVPRFVALCAVLGTATFMVGFVTPYWLRSRTLDSKAGLWRNCVGDHCTGIVNLDRE